MSDALEQVVQFDIAGLDENDVQEIKSYQYNSDAYVDVAIKRVKEYETEIKRFEKMLEEEIKILTSHMQEKIDKIQKKKNWDEFNLGNIIKEASDKKETKTQWKKTYISGDIILEKEERKINKPKIGTDILEKDTRLEDFIKTKTEKVLDWENLKTKLDIRKDKVINIETGEEYTDIVPITVVPEKVVIK